MKDSMHNAAIRTLQDTIDRMEVEKQELTNELSDKADRISELADKLEEAEKLIYEACDKLLYYTPFK